MSEPTGVRPGSRSAGAPAGRGRLTGERLAALFVVGTALLNFPLLSVLRGRGPVAGIPALYVYLFLVWLVLAGATGLALRGRPPDVGHPGSEPGPGEP